jgi:small subunit ribosomal protein S20
VAKRTASAKKQARASVRRTLRNRAVRSEVKTKIVKARHSLTGGPVGEADRYAIALEAVRALDRAASKGVLHRNNAARRKARLTRQLVKLGALPAAGALAATGGKSKKGAAPAKGAVASGKAKAPDKKAAAKKPGSR